MSFCRYVASMCGLVLCVTAVAEALEDPKSGKPLFSAFEKFYRFRAAATRVDTGDPSSATGYYEAVAKSLKMPDDRLCPTLDALLVWFGCPSKAADLEAATPEELSGPKHGVPSLRYFSPKTTDVSGRQQPQLLSWRKVMRVRAAAGSPAERAGIRDLWWLTNLYSSDVDAPFKGKSQNNQIILVPSKSLEFAVGSGLVESHTILFAAYGPADLGYPLARSTATSWDGGTVNVEAPADPNQEYFIPQSCIQCHGGSPRNGRLNVFDTDYYVWRSEDSDDFPSLQNHRWWSTDKAGFLMLSAQQLNLEVLEQNKQIDMQRAKGETFTTKSTIDWVARHDKSFAVVPAAERGWNGNNPELVGLLVKYCYRCHGTLEFSVLDGDSISKNIDGRRDALLDRLGADMPQDRNLEADKKTSDDLRRIRQLLTELGENKK